MELEKLLSLCALCFIQSCSTQTDIALNKPAFMSSGFRKNEYARRANNGNNSTSCCGSYCTQTYREDSPYWGVDLQDTYRLDSVYLLARSATTCNALNCTIRLGNLEIRAGFSKDDVGSNNLCNFFDDVVAPGTDRTIACDQPTCGRYLTIQRVGYPQNEELNICQVKAFTSGLPIQYKSLITKTKVTGQYFDGYQTADSQEVSSTTDCLRLCLTNQMTCRSVNYYVSNGVKMCDINSKAEEDDASFVLTPDASSTYYSLVQSTCG